MGVSRPVSASSSPLPRPQPDLPYLELLDMRRALVPDESAPRLRCAVLGGWAVTPLLELLALFCASWRLSIEVREAPFATIAQELVDAQSATRRWAPDVVLVLPTPDDVSADFLHADDAWAAADEEADAWMERLRHLAEAGAAVIMGAFVAPEARMLGRLAGAGAIDLVTRLRLLNLALLRRAGGGVRVHDTDHLAATLGYRRWHDPVYWQRARVAVSFDCLPHLAADLARAMATIFQRTARCLVLDLDDTLWGGQVAEDGVDGIAIGPTPEGEPFLALQRHALALRETGVLLAACSRNDPSVARAPFERRDEMVLRLDDFACFITGFGDKAAMVEEVATRLHLRLDALVFVDNDPIERARVATALPDVRVVALPDDPALFARALDLEGAFGVAERTDEDAQRSRRLQQDGMRAQRSAAAVDLATFLTSLGMRARVTPLTDADVDRVTQLVNRANQFNLNGARLTEGAVRARLRDGASLDCVLRLRDDVGDHGLVSVLLATLRSPDAVEIEVWVMSCRVLARGVEGFLLRHVLEGCRARGVRLLRGRFVDTGRNHAVGDLIARLGLEVAADGSFAFEVTDPSRWPQSASIEDDTSE